VHPAAAPTTLSTSATVSHVARVRQRRGSKPARIRPDPTCPPSQISAPRARGTVTSRSHPAARTPAVRATARVASSGHCAARRLVRRSSHTSASVPGARSITSPLCSRTAPPNTAPSRARSCSSSGPRPFVRPTWRTRSAAIAPSGPDPAVTVPRTRPVPKARHGAYRRRSAAHSRQPAAAISRVFTQNAARASVATAPTNVIRPPARPAPRPPLAPPPPFGPPAAPGPPPRPRAPPPPRRAREAAARA
jgi:hypothetical protein